MNELNLPAYPFRIRNSGQNKEIFDSLRRKYVTLTPEEWVRQHFIMFAHQSLRYPVSLIAVERGLKVNTLSKRADIVVYNRNGSPWMIVECKAPQVRLNEDTFYQAASYHMKLNVKFLVVTNGMNHYCCKFENESFSFVEGFPEYNS